ncbi:MAG: hypothetical protein WBD99_01995 [Thermodesulfobacteriota bacterium]
MDYQKIDAALAVALNDIQNAEEGTLTLFIHTTHVLSSTETEFLERLGIKVMTSGQQIFTATISARAVAELSDQPWVRYLKLSSKLRPLSER